MRLMIALVIVLTGCVTPAPRQTYSEGEMMTAAAALTKVTTAAEAKLRYGPPSDTLSDAEFLAQSVAHDPGLLKPVAGYQVKARRQGRQVAILVCSADGAIALLEDAGVHCGYGSPTLEGQTQESVRFHDRLGAIVPRGHALTGAAQRCRISVPRGECRIFSVDRLHLPKNPFTSRLMKGSATNWYE